MIGLWYGFIILSRIDKKRNSAENDLQKAFTHTEEEVQARTKELKAEVENRIKTENQLKAELHFSDILIDSIPGVLYLYDQQFNFLRWNKTFETVTKYSADEISKMKPLDFFPDSDKEAIGKKITMVFDNGFSEFEGNLILKSGEMIPFDFNNHRLIKGDKKYLLGIGINISEKKKNEAEIIKLNLDLEQKVEEKTRKLQETNQELESFSYTVSHDLRAPLRHIVGFIELFNNSFSSTLNDKGKRYLDIIHSSAKHMAHLIDDLLSFSRIGRTSVNKTKASFNPLIDTIINEFNKEITDRKINLKISELPIVEADYNLFYHVWSNLISNAIKYTSKTDNPEIIIDYKKNESNNEITFFIKDNGAGFNMAYYNKMFNTFQRLHGKDEFEGSGIGLANVKKIIDKHDGKIWAEGEENKGATFYFSI